jgi:signal transduction histidine kinase
MVNLMENAANYGGGVTEISVHPGAGATVGPAGTLVPTVELTVDDAGPGIDPLERTKVFERFYRGSAAGRRGAGTGTGLGLALVAEHMHVMRGDVRVETSPAGGARLTLTLPVAAWDEEEHAGGGADAADGRSSNGDGLDGVRDAGAVAGDDAGAGVTT